MGYIPKILHTSSLALQKQGDPLVDNKHIIRITLEVSQIQLEVATSNHFQEVLFPCWKDFNFHLCGNWNISFDDNYFSNKFNYWNERSFWHKRFFSCWGVPIFDLRHITAIVPLNYDLKFYNKVLQEWLDNNNILMSSRHNEGKSVNCWKIYKNIKD